MIEGAMSKHLAPSPQHADFGLTIHALMISVPFCAGNARDVPRRDARGQMECSVLPYVTNGKRSAPYP